MQHHCIAICLSSAHLLGMSDVSNLIQSTEVYECFNGNAVEVEIMLDYLGTQHILPWHIYNEVNLSLLYSNNVTASACRRTAVQSGPLLMQPGVVLCPLQCVYHSRLLLM